MAMKRRLDLIFAILEWLEEQQTTWAEIPKDLRAYPEDVVAYHVELCMQAGFIHTGVETSGYTRLTWKGHEKLLELRGLVDGFCS